MASAAILAGGQARRLGGVDKSRLIVDGRTILDRQIDVLRGLSDDLMLVGALPDRADPRCRLVEDGSPGLGPLAGLDAALEAMHSDVLLVVACDMPFITRPLMQRLLDLAPGVDAVVPRSNRGHHPLCAIYAASCRPVVRQQLEARHLAVHATLARLRVREAGADELAGLGDLDHLLANVNTAAELHGVTAATHNL
jgi:molybdopterin-guanine dinucleotide biosynthesis protein A